MRSMLRTWVGGALIGCIAMTAWADEPKSKETPGATAQARLLAALQTTADALRSRSLEPAELPRFHELLAAAEAFWQDPSVPLDRRAKWCGLAKSRLTEGAATLRRQEAAAVPVAKRPTTVSPRSTTLAQVAPPGGLLQIGNPQTGSTPNTAADEAQRLIELIQSVVRPDTWDVNGGQGTIKYWSLGHALIIYNTVDVHERIGGSVGFLRN